MAATLNKVMLIGRLGRDPELRYTQSGSPVANFSMATDESYTDRDGNRVDRAEWHKVVVWSRQAEAVSNYLRKGSLVYVEGRIQTNKWEDRDGQTRYTTEIRADRVQFLDPKSRDAEQENYGAGPRKPARQDSRQAPRRDREPEPGPNEDLGPAFPSEASGMDDVPF
ncbi:MAG: single-stranded DNA-binding protein [Thermodesulfobacteriota bacterium]|nr:single-stranded DNA-binding protein [Thermodesulfobacteriota bacterium]